MMFLLDAPTPRSPTVQWVMIVVAIVTIIYVTIIRPSAKKKKDPLAKSPSSANSLSYQRNVERQMQSLLVELSEMARQITAQLDTRTQKLQMLLQDADERIEKLQQTSRPISIEPIATQTWTAPAELPTRIEVAPPPEPVDEQHQQVYTLADQGQSAMDISRELNRPRGEVELILALRPTATNAER